MKKKYCLIAISIFMMFSTFAKDKNERDPFELVLAVDEEQYFAAEIPQSPYVINDSIIQIYLGEKVYIEADVKDNVLTNLKRVESIKKPKKTLTIEFIQQSEGKNHQFMMLTITNPFSKTLSYSAHICLVKYARWVDTNVVDVMAGISSIETWPDLISSIALDEFKLVD